MNGKQHYEILRNAHSRSHLIEHAKFNGILWKEAPHEGVNWLRASRSIIDYLDDNSEFLLEDLDIDTASSMLDLYNQLRELHKKTMYPHLRSAMNKIDSENRDSSKSNTELLNEAHSHVDKHGGWIWREKVDVLNTLNRQISYLEGRTQGMEDSSTQEE